MSRRGVTLTLSLFLLSSVIPAGAQKNKIAPQAVDKAAQEAKDKEKAKEKETKNGVLKGWADDVYVIITDEERKAFKKLTKDEERENFVENFWLVRDPSPDTPENEFRDQYYERIDYANDHFTSGIAGMHTDRGKMYILNGLADEVQTHPTGGAYYRPKEEGGGFTTTFPFETWRYRHLDGKGDNIVYEFVDQTMSGEYKLEYDPSAKDALRNVPNAGLTQAEIDSGADKSERYSKNQSLFGGSSAALPEDYGRENIFDILQKYNDAYKPNDVKYKDLMVPASTRLSTSVLPFKVQASYIKAAEEVRTLINVQIMTGDLAFHDDGGAQLAQAHITGVIYRADNRRLPGFSNDVNVEFPTMKSKMERLDQPNLYQITRYMLPGKYKLHLTIEDKHSQNVGVQDFLLTVPRIPEQVLQASSMILAYSITDLPPHTLGTEPFALGEKKVKPNVTGIYKQNQDLNVWQEFYGLTIDQTTHKPSATFELVISQNKKDLKKVVTESTELAGSGQQMKYTNSVPLAEFAPGQYEVQIKVTDNLAKESSVTSSKFTIAAGPAK